MNKLNILGIGLGTITTIVTPNVIGYSQVTYASDQKIDDLFKPLWPVTNGGLGLFQYKLKWVNSFDTIVIDNATLKNELKMGYQLNPFKKVQIIGNKGMYYTWHFDYSDYDLEIIGTHSLPDNNTLSPVKIRFFNTKTGASRTETIQVILRKSKERIFNELNLTNKFKSNNTLPQLKTEGITNTELKDALNKGSVKTNITDAGYDFEVDKLTLTDNNIPTQIKVRATFDNIQKKTPWKTINVTLPKSVERVNNEKLIPTYFKDTVLQSQPNSGISNSNLHSLLNVGDIKKYVTDIGYTFTTNKSTLTDNNTPTYVNINIFDKNNKPITTKTIKITLPYSQETLLKQDRETNKLLSLFNHLKLPSQPTLKQPTIAEIKAILSKIPKIKRDLLDKGHSFNVLNINNLKDNLKPTKITISVTHSSGYINVKTVSMSLNKSTERLNFESIKETDLTWFTGNPNQTATKFGDPNEFSKVHGKQVKLNLKTLKNITQDTYVSMIRDGWLQIQKIISYKGLHKTFYKNITGFKTDAQLLQERLNTPDPIRNKKWLLTGFGYVKSDYTKDKVLQQLKSSNGFNKHIFDKVPFGLKYTFEVNTLNKDNSVKDLILTVYKNGGGVYALKISIFYITSKTAD